MMPVQTLLDTDTLSAYMRRDGKVVAKAKDYLRTYRQFSFSIMTRYEILRGLKAKGATTKLRSFGELCMVNNILPLTEAVVVRAADVYADLYRRGELIGEGDTLIAATALVHGLVLVTNNVRHFDRVKGLQIENWLRS